jgi:hypothetical protein
VKILKIKSKKHGSFQVKLDNEDYEKVTNTWRSPKWCVRICKKRHNLVYLQKRLPSQRLIELHRFVIGAKKGDIVDHINGNTLDNRKSNLRIVSNGANIRKGKIRVNNKTGYTGIEIRKNQPIKPYGAKIRVNYKYIWLGSYKTMKEAIKARKIAEKEYYNI